MNSHSKRRILLDRIRKNLQGMVTKVRSQKILEKRSEMGEERGMEEHGVASLRAEIVYHI